MCAVPSNGALHNLARRKTDRLGQETTTMKTSFLAISALALMIGTAHAESEGNGDPFPNAAPRAVVANQVLSDTGSETTPHYGRAIAVLTQGDLLPTNGSEGAVQTANSLPTGAAEGTVAYAQARSMRQWVAARQGTNSIWMAARTASYN